MSFGKMNDFLKIIKTTHGTDAEGFPTKTETVIAEVRCYREGRHGSIRWANLAAFSQATDLFRFRVIPGVEINTDCIFECDGVRYRTTSVNILRSMYIEVLAVKVVPTDG